MRCIASKKDPSEVLVLSNVFFYSEIFFGIDVRFFFFFFFNTRPVLWGMFTTRLLYLHKYSTRYFFVVAIAVSPKWITCYVGAVTMNITVNALHIMKFLREETGLVMSYILFRTDIIALMNSRTYYEAVHIM